MEGKYNMKFKKYWYLTKGGIMQSLFFRSAYYITFLGNIMYIMVTYYLWKSIYKSSPVDVINGMSFQDTLIYMVLATALSNVMQTNFIWTFGQSIRSGKIAMELVRPMNYQLYMFWSNIGRIIVGFITTFIPTAIIIYIISSGKINLGINSVFLIISIIVSIIINYCFDFIAGIICLYTESVWGVNILKEVLVLLLSGATIPIAFFPELLKDIVMWLPFQAIYNIPLSILIKNNYSISDYTRLILIQIIWVIIIIFVSNQIWKRTIKVLTVNGG